MIDNKTTDLAFGKVFEHCAAEVYARHLWPAAEIRSTGTYGDIDFFVFVEGSLVGAIEVKSRRCASTAFESTIVSERKHQAARYLRHFFQVRTDCVILFTDTLATFNLVEKPDSIEVIQRIDRSIAVPHAVYAHSRLGWHPDLYVEILIAAEAEQGLDNL